MSKLFYRILVLASVLASIPSFGAEKCILSVKSFMHGPDCSELEKRYEPIQKDNWQECYLTAEKLAQEIGDQGPSGVVAIDKFGCNTFVGNVTRFRYVEWEFDDSYLPFAETHGKLSASTTQFQKMPKAGNQIYLENGNLVSY